MRPIEHVTAGHDIDFSADLDLHQAIMTRPVERFKSLQFRKCSVELVSTSLDPLIEYLVGRVSALIMIAIALSQAAVEDARNLRCLQRSWPRQRRHFAD